MIHGKVKNNVNADRTIKRHNNNNLMPKNPSTEPVHFDSWFEFGCN